MFSSFAVLEIELSSYTPFVLIYYLSLLESLSDFPDCGDSIYSMQGIFN